jgi:type IV secretion system protein VirB9
MDARRFLTVLALSMLALGGCAAMPTAITSSPVVGSSPPPQPAQPPVETVTSEPEAPVAEPVLQDTARPYLEVVAASSPWPSGRRARRHARPPPDAAVGRAAIAAANRSARATSSAEAFQGGVQRFAWEEGRVYEVWTAPLRVTVLTLAPGETVTAKAAGDTVRWQIGESQSGGGASTRTHVLIKPLRTGLETNLVLTTNQKIYHLLMRSGGVDGFNTAVTWDHDEPPVPAEPFGASPLQPLDVAAVAPQGPLDARYRIAAVGRSPQWAPTAVFNDGVRTFVILPPHAASDEAPALFVRQGEELQLINYRQSGGLLIVDRLFDEAELRLGDRRPQVVRIRRLTKVAR